MFSVRLASRRIPRLAHKSPITSQARPSSTATEKKPKPFPTIPSCPPASCECAGAPTMPEGFEIDYSKPLNGSMPAYNTQVLFCTGENDWPSKIEDMNEGSNIVSEIKKLIGRGGEFHNPYHNIVPLAASFAPSVSPETQTSATSAYILPQFTYIPTLPSDPESLKSLITSHLLNTTPADTTIAAQPINDILVLICGHGGRDIRCGVLGPILESEFKAKLSASGLDILEGSPDQSSATTGRNGARVGLISHIGGHKFAGNIIIYLPPGLTTKSGEKHTLAGKGIWYGRVMPEHVEGIVRETIVEGNVIEDIFRGGVQVGSEGTEILRL